MEEAPRKRLGMAGAGLMGRGIAQVAAQAGFEVRLLDARPEASGAPSLCRTARTPAACSASPSTALGAASHSKRTPSSSACSTSRREPGMFSRSRR